MAQLLKRRAHKPFAEESVTVGWSNTAEGERFNLEIGAFKLKLSRTEAERIAERLSAMLSDPELLDIINEMRTH